MTRRRRPAARLLRRAVAEPLEGRALLSATVAFGAVTSFTAGTAPVALATADFNGDGNADLAVADATSEKVDVFFGTGTGTFTAGPVLSLSAPPTSIVTGDFNGDGFPDIAVGGAPGSANSGTTVTVFLGSATGAFGLGQATTVETGVGTSEAIALATADFNADGHLDLAATDPTDGAVTVLLGTGSGTFGTPVVVTDVGSDPTAIVAGDLTGDGKADFAVTTTVTDTSTGTSTDAVTLVPGEGNGQFGSPTVTTLTASGSTELAIGDLTGDGKAIDLAVGNADGTVTLLVNQGTGTFVASAGPTVAAASTGIAIADLNLDGHGDVVTADGGTALSSGADAVTVLPGAGLGTLGTAGQFTVGSLPEGVAIADFNGDGKPDVATANQGAGTVSILLNTTTVTTIATSTTLAVDAATAPAGSPVTLTATVKPASVSTLTGESFPSGSVNFYDGTTLVGTAALVKGSVAGTGTATVALTTLTVGTHKLTARYAADTAYAASASTAATEVITATATSGPDLVATFLPITLPATVVPGEAGSVKVKITNSGNSTATGSITNGLFLSLDSMLDDADTPVTVKGSLAKTNLKLAVGKSVTLAGTFAIPAATPLGDYVLLVDANTNGGVSESSTANNVAASPTAYAVADQFGTVGGKKGVSLQLADPAGTVGTFKLSGPGTGTLDVGDDGVDLTLAGTSAATAVTITASASATFQLHTLSAEAAIGTIKAPSATVADTIDLRSSATSLTFGDLSAATLTAGGGIKSLTVANWTAGSLSAAWIGTLKSAAAFSATTTLAGTAAPRGVTLQSLTVAGDATAALTATGNVGAILIRGQMTGTLAVADGSLASYRVLSAMTGTVGVAEGSIGAITTLGAVGANVTFTAESFPKRAILGGVAVDPATDTHFQTAPVMVPLV